jgi:ABC-type multidrug transport system fused ATPase/permease subunit
MALRIPFIMLPLAIQFVVQVTISYKRAQDYLLLPDQPPLPRLPPAAAEGAAADGAVALSLEDATLGWPQPPLEPAAAPKPGKKGGKKKKPPPQAAGMGASVAASVASSTDGGPAAAEAEETPAEGAPAAAPDKAAAGAPAAARAVTTALAGVSLQVLRGELVGVVGAVGTGKSSLLGAACGECLVSAGAVRAAEKLAAVPQRPFIISGTVLDNILLGREHDAARLHEVLEASSLLPDLEALPQRELTEVRRAALTR